MPIDLMTGDAGIGQFENLLSPALRAEIPKWLQDEGLRLIALRLRKHQRRRTFLDTLAEALVALHLRRNGCTLRFEIPTPHGRTCDFEVNKGGNHFYLHVKRIETDRPALRRLTISSRLRVLEQIARPYVVAVRWREEASDADMQRLVREASDFILQSRIGDEMVVKSDEGREIGGVLIAAPWSGAHVSLVIGLPSGFIDEVSRLRRALDRAYRQFMPRGENVVLLCSSHESDREDFESALFGAHVERWDAYPPRDRRIAHGRDNDGFWFERRHEASRAAGWFCLRPESSERSIRWHRRPGSAEAGSGITWIDALFDGVQIPSS